MLDITASHLSRDSEWQVRNFSINRGWSNESTVSSVFCSWYPSTRSRPSCAFTFTNGLYTLSLSATVMSHLPLRLSSLYSALILHLNFMIKRSFSVILSPSIGYGLFPGCKNVLVVKMGFGESLEVDWLGLMYVAPLHALGGCWVWELIIRKVIWIGVFQYCFLRLILTILAVAAESKNLYCEDSDNIAFAHVWVSLTSKLLGKRLKP